VKIQIKEALEAEIVKKIVVKGELKNPSQNFELLDIHSNYDSHKHSQTALGGYLQ